jgi:hypothetical protein
VKSGTSSESYAPVSRGLRQHLAKMSGNAVKLYLELLLSAAFAGPNKGQIAVSFAELAMSLKMHRQTVHKAARKLRPYFIEWEPAKNQHDVTVFKIQKFKSIKDFAVSRTAHSEVTADDLPDEKSDKLYASEVTAPSVIDTNDNGLPGPKKLKKPKKEAAAAALPKTEDSVWNFLEIHPCGPLSFRSLLEAGWATRNSGPYSPLVGNALDAWEAAEGQRPNGCVPLFRALAKLRENEKRAPRPGAISSEPIHAFRPEEIPA